VSFEVCPKSFRSFVADMKQKRKYYAKNNSILVV